MNDDLNGERRVNWARAMADIAVIKEIQIQQTATLAKLDGKLDLLWDNHQRDIGRVESENKTNRNWRWILSTSVAVLGTVLGYRIVTHP